MGEPRAAAPETKKITVKDITWFYAVGEGFQANGVTVYPEDKHVLVFPPGSSKVPEAEQIIVAKTGELIFVPRAWLWREERTREVEVPVE